VVLKIARREFDHLYYLQIVQGKDEEIPIPNLTKEMVKVWVIQNRDRKILADILS
jgi:hypothetical protein